MTRAACAVAVLVGLAAVADVGAQRGRSAKDLARPYRPSYESTGEVEVLPVQGTVYMLAGGGSNVTVQVGPNALFVVDTNPVAMRDKLVAAIKPISHIPIATI